MMSDQESAVLDRYGYLRLGPALRSLKCVLDNSVMWLTPRGIAITYLEAHGYVSCTVLDKDLFSEYSITKMFAFNNRAGKIFLLDFICSPKRADFIKATFSVLKENENHSLSLRLEYENEWFTICKPACLEKTSVFDFDLEEMFEINLGSSFTNELIGWLGVKNNNTGPLMVTTTCGSTYDKLTFSALRRGLPPLEFNLKQKDDTPDPAVPEKTSGKALVKKNLASKKANELKAARIVLTDGYLARNPNRKVRIDYPLELKRVLSAYKVSKTFSPSLGFPTKFDECCVVVTLDPLPTCTIPELKSHTIFFSTVSHPERRGSENSTSESEKDADSDEDTSPIEARKRSFAEISDNTDDSPAVPPPAKLCK
ncbi:DNA polymerase processivity subunit [Testudinid alphaherpesvirus 3]|uniref:DNA polymerase processivity protein n=1 Tax=Testudinid alphaherpesvirus 3 TaxID=2560801 RepID=A0A0K1R1C9_9ALPH|nr:DNA polymerase processivity subunit [Testudinid alphaherpesvirus 3]AIU39245.1 DNA polymerase processivity subunit [Testudinid alphaherpesvirus 3]AIU39355.1 DNA polymerase processivity subunit [Testudinid alphaherpesvirus 3]AKI81631.1 DNA polymerase processivity subunit [Testudinid alphaherpesvirus 3]AKI81735.1 DNA polymerase processivity subunit [Testudinid alphaherpesvirus 3]AKV40714.1 DNA polymerase processivity protein [Testudinid alphaherpesvirus 3]